MEYSYENYLIMKENKNKFANAIELGIQGMADIPIIGNTIHAGAQFLNENLQNMNQLRKSLITNKQLVQYFILQSDDYYSDLITKVFKILEIKKIQQKYAYQIDNLKVDLDEYFDDNDVFIENALLITFLDNKYLNTRTNENEFGMIVISFKEEFKQINFSDNVVYSAFNIISVGMSHKDNPIKRDYIEFANLICYLLKNSNLIK